MSQVCMSGKVLEPLKRFITPILALCLCSCVASFPERKDLFTALKTQEVIEKTETIQGSPPDVTVKERFFEEYTPPKVTKTRDPSKEEEEEKPDLSKLNLREDKVIINVDRMPIFDFLIHVFSEVLMVPFVVSEDVRAMNTPVTLRTPEPISVQQALEIVVALLKEHRLKVSMKAGALFIKRQPATSQQPPRVVGIGERVPTSSGQIVQLVPLKYLRVQDILPILTDIYRGEMTIRAFPKENTLLITGNQAQIATVLDFINTIDIPYFASRQILMTNLIYWKAEEFVKQLEEILKSLNIPISKSPQDPGIQLIPLKHSNILIVTAPDEKVKNIVKEWIKKLDSPENLEAEIKVFTYYPLYGRASDLVEAITRLFSGQGSGLRDSRDQLHTIRETRPPESRSPTPTPQTQLPPASPTPPQTTPQIPREKITTQTLAGLTGDNFRISADERRNVILVASTPQVYKVIYDLLRELDKPTRQVLIETMIAEVTLKDDLQYGVEWFLRNRLGGGNFTLKTLEGFGLAQGLPAGKLQGLVYYFVSDAEKFKALFNLFAQKNLIKILSTPRVLVLDNEEATINVGMDVPVITGEQTTSGVTQTGVGVVRTFQYRTTGITLKVKPTINTEGLLTLNISQEVSEVAPNKISNIESPIIYTRKITSTVIAPSGHSIILGGLIRETRSQAESKVPLLGDIPLLGALFKSYGTGSDRTELIIMLTPRILSTVEELVKITNQLREEFLKAQNHTQSHTNEKN